MSSTLPDGAHGVGKPIETHYKGCRFRSRLEARWAVFFDALGTSWEYEPEGFELPSGRYLPDFRLTLPNAGIWWWEVKPYAGDFATDRRWMDLVRFTGHPMFVSFGMHREGDDCKNAHGITAVMRLRGRLTASRFPGLLPSKPGEPFVRARALDAFAAASSARFEFGESGAPTPRRKTSSKRLLTAVPRQSAEVDPFNPNGHQCPRGAWTTCHVDPFNPGACEVDDHWVQSTGRHDPAGGGDCWSYGSSRDPFNPHAVICRNILHYGGAR